MANAVKTKENGKVAVLDINMFEQDAGAGLSNLGTEDMALPFLKILSRQDPVLDELDNAKAGDFLNTVTNQVYKGKEGVDVIPCSYQRVFIQWMPRGQGTGAPVAIFSPTDDNLPPTERHKNDTKDYVVDGGGSYLEQTCQWYIKVVEKDGTVSNALLALKSTQLKKSRKWMSMIMSRQMTGKNGSFTPPMYSHIYTLKTLPEQNSLGDWHGVEMSLKKQVDDVHQYKSAKTFAESVEKGDVNVKHTQDSDKESEDIPF